MPSSSGSMVRSSGINASDNPQARHQRQGGKHHRADDVKGGLGIFALLQQQDAIERKSGKSGVAAQNADSEESAEFRRQVQLKRAGFHDQSHQKSTGSGDDKEAPGKAGHCV